MNSSIHLVLVIGNGLFCGFLKERFIHGFTSHRVWAALGLVEITSLLWQNLDRALRYLLIVCYMASREELKLSLVLSQGSNVDTQNPPGMAELLF